MSTQSGSFKLRIKSLASWLRDAALITSGGWLAIGLLILALPLKQVILTNPFMPTIAGVVLGTVFVAGATVTGVIYWLITGRNALNVLLRMEW